MPSFYTHYIFGTENYKEMEQSELKKIIRRHKKAYALGLSGPDIFFYNLLDTPLGKKKPGEMLHLYRTNRFFSNMLAEIEKLDKEEREIGFAYLTGFVGHYILDVHCHPYVYSHIDRRNPLKETGEHFMLEVAMDVYFCGEYYHRRLTSIKQTSLVRISKRERSVICRLVSEAYNRTFGFPHLSVGSLRLVLGSVPFIMTVLRDSCGGKERLLRPLEQKLLGFPFLSPLFMNNQCYGKNKQEFAVFQNLFLKGLDEYKSLMPDMNRVLCEKGDKTAEKILLRKLKNRSYHTGEECEVLKTEIFQRQTLKK